MCILNSISLRRKVAAVCAAFGLWLGGASSANAGIYSLTTADTWTGAEAQAVAAGGHLVTINDAAEQAVLLATFGPSELFWIGFTDETTEGTFVWVSGQAVTYTNWNGGEPNNLGGEDYTVMNWGPAGSWNDLPDLPGIRGIIEVEAVPEPASLTILGLGALSLIGYRLRRRKQAVEATA